MILAIADNDYEYTCGHLPVLSDTAVHMRLSSTLFDLNQGHQRSFKVKNDRNLAHIQFLTRMTMASAFS